MGRSPYLVRFPYGASYTPLCFIVVVVFFSYTSSPLTYLLLLPTSTCFLSLPLSSFSFFSCLSGQLLILFLSSLNALNHDQELYLLTVIYPLPLSLLHNTQWTQIICTPWRFLPCHFRRFFSPPYLPLSYHSSCSPQPSTTLHNLDFRSVFSSL